LDKRENRTPRFASSAPLVRLICDHLECPDMGRGSQKLKVESQK
jgi:hypothetical protein